MNKRNNILVKILSNPALLLPATGEASLPDSFLSPPLQVKTWFQNRRMKHKKQLRKSQDDAKASGPEGADLAPGDSALDPPGQASVASTSEARPSGPAPAFLPEDPEDEVDIIEGGELCGPQHLI